MASGRSSKNANGSMISKNSVATKTTTALLTLPGVRGSSTEPGAAGRPALEGRWLGTLRLIGYP